MLRARHIGVVMFAVSVLLSLLVMACGGESGGSSAAASEQSEGLPTVTVAKTSKVNCFQVLESQPGTQVTVNDVATCKAESEATTFAGKLEFEARNQIGFSDLSDDEKRSKAERVFSPLLQSTSPANLSVFWSRYRQVQGWPDSTTDEGVKAIRSQLRTLIQTAEGNGFDRKQEKNFHALRDVLLQLYDKQGR